MKASFLYSLWLRVAGGVITIDIALRAICKGFYSRNDREWVKKTIQAWVRRLFKLLKLTVDVYNPHQVAFEPGVPYIIMCNHSSLLDIPISFYAFPNQSIRMLAKKELSYIPLLAQGMRKTEFPFIDRKNRKQAIEDLKKAKEIMNSGIVLWIAPEGTRSKDGKLQAFKKGGFITAIEAKAMIVPIGIRNAHKILPKGAWRVNLGEAVEVHIGEPIDASNYNFAQKEALIDKVHQEMNGLLANQSENVTIDGK